MIRQPFYPYPTQEWRSKFAMYRALMDQETNISFIGRLAEYQYYNMDVIIDKALKLADYLAKK